MVELTDSAIHLTRILNSVQSNDAGAVVLFLGTTRETTNGRKTESLDYECYREMAESELRKLEISARERWPIQECQITHRLGHLELGEASVAVAVSTAHRADAFEAAKWLIDTVKEVVPIWKRENWADGSSEWVHPGVDQTGPSASGEFAP